MFSQANIIHILCTFLLLLLLCYIFVFFCRLLFALSRPFPVLACRLLVKCTMGRLQQLSMRVTSTCSYDVTTGSTKKMFSG